MRIRIIDAFADRPFTGNPAAVCLLEAESWPDQSWMQQVAAEMNLSETAFAHPLPGNADADWTLRWFTPTVEADLCGHATLAPYWSSRLGQPSLTGLQASVRTGLVRTTIHGDRVHLTGRAITVLDGTLRHFPG
jgi:PhzF family phenazine biosynthesis protein